MRRNPSIDFIIPLKGTSYMDGNDFVGNDKFIYSELMYRLVIFNARRFAQMKLFDIIVAVRTTTNDSDEDDDYHW